MSNINIIPNIHTYIDDDINYYIDIHPLINNMNIHINNIRNINNMNNIYNININDINDINDINEDEEHIINNNLTLDNFIYNFNNCDAIKELNKFNMTECPITLNTFINNQLVIILNCNHIFDYEAFKEWYNNKNNKCPLCKCEIK
jgi:hypothetical protein